ncbi:MAG TPA: hypothetical protein VFK11_05095 [Candidatus Saccharimonadales bacterium]|nr:hypothetical protein [Candidatus Saccharimonadales bacterium]
MADNKQPITLDLPVRNQNINVDVESIAPILGFKPGEAYDVANMTVTAELEVPQEQEYRLVLRGDVEAGTHAFARIVSADKNKFKEVTTFKKLSGSEIEELAPVLEKAGIPYEKSDLKSIAKGFKIADIKIPAGNHVLRIHSSQKLLPVNDNPKAYQLVLYAPLLSLKLTGGATKLSASVVFPAQFEEKADIADPAVEPMPGQSMPQLDADFNGKIACQRAMAWCWHNDPKITISYTYK